MLSLHCLPVRQRITYKMALTAHKVRATAMPTYLSDLVHTRAPALWSFDALQMVILEPTRSGTIHLQYHSSMYLECPTCWTSTVPQNCFIQTMPKDTSVYPQLVIPHRHQRLCIFGLHGALQILSLLLLFNCFDKWHKCTQPTGKTDIVYTAFATAICVCSCLSVAIK